MQRYIRPGTVDKLLYTPKSQVTQIKAKITKQVSYAISTCRSNKSQSFPALIQHGWLQDWTQQEQATDANTMLTYVPQPKPICNAMLICQIDSRHWPSLHVHQNLVLRILHDMGHLPRRNPMPSSVTHCHASIPSHANSVGFVPNWCWDCC